MKEAVANRKTAADAHYSLGSIARQDGHAEEAIAELKEFLALRPDQPDALEELSQISLQARDYAQAANLFDAALRGDPENYAANFRLLQLYARSGDTRRDQQSQKFDGIKDQKEERDNQMMRAIESRPDNDQANQPTKIHDSGTPMQ